ncbi:Pkinase-domain-containing protein [Aulographum hederae CBS 113979]|uniref:Pkinase-domain-containing protein n=1 Tax=Aulographum hederae CBS 113979 TaxID=1176131 RepID=A0A6G1H3L3_9PEZI|nr:Pkinase-domain-containing protein [Aulographum hederae CBS 113979]
MEDSPQEPSTAAVDPTIDLSEQLNIETRNKYVKGKEIGSGTYAFVYKGHLRDEPNTLVAIKKMKVMENYKDGLTMDAVRETKYLQELSHPNIIKLYDVFTSKDTNMNLVLEFLPRGDLEQLIHDTGNVRYNSADTKAWMGMVARGIWFCHENFVLHRDLKPNNLLIAADGEVKLADFGLARSFSEPHLAMSTEVITRWYRPPELFYRARQYSGAVDIWSVGCIFAELILRNAFLPGQTDIDQVEVICQRIGTPTEENWPGVSKLASYVPVAKDKVRPVQPKSYYMQLFGTVGPFGVDLLMSMFTLDPRKRVTAKGILDHEYWAKDPRPTDKENLPKKGGGEKKMGEDLKRKGGVLEEGKADKVARKIDFGAMKK